MSTQDILLNAFVEGTLYGLLPLSLIFIIVFGLAYPFVRRRFDALVLASFGGVGCFLGIFIGGSREPAVGAVLPGVVTLIGAFVAYYFTKEKEVFDRKLIPPTILSLVVAAAFGGSFSSELRQTQDQFEYLREIEKSERESRIRRAEAYQEQVIGVLNRHSLCIQKFSEDVCLKLRQ